MPSPFELSEQEVLQQPLHPQQHPAGTRATIDIQWAFHRLEKPYLIEVMRWKLTADGYSCVVRFRKNGHSWPLSPSDVSKTHVISID